MNKKLYDMAAIILGVKTIPEKLCHRLDLLEQHCNKLGGSISSRQIVSLAVLMYQKDEIFFALLKMKAWELSKEELDELLS